MSKEKKARAAGGLEDRPADLVLEVLEWLDDEPRKTGMKSKTTEAPKYERNARVRNPQSGKVAVVPVVGTMAQFQHASSTEVEGFFRADRKKVYVGPKISKAEVDASDLI